MAEDGDKSNIDRVAQCNSVKVEETGFPIVSALFVTVGYTVNLLCPYVDLLCFPAHLTIQQRDMQTQDAFRACQCATFEFLNLNWEK